MATITVKHDDGSETTHDVPEMGAKQIEATLDLWAQFPKGIHIEFDDGEELTIENPLGGETP